MRSVEKFGLFIKVASFEVIFGHWIRSSNFYLIKQTNICDKVLRELKGKDLFHVVLNV